MDFSVFAHVRSNSTLCLPHSVRAEVGRFIQANAINQRKKSLWMAWQAILRQVVQSLQARFGIYASSICFSNFSINRSFNLQQSISPKVICYRLSRAQTLGMMSIIHRFIDISSTVIGFNPSLLCYFFGRGYLSLTVSGLSVKGRRGKPIWRSVGFKCRFAREKYDYKDGNDGRRNGGREEKKRKAQEPEWINLVG